MTDPRSHPTAAVAQSSSCPADSWPAQQQVQFAGVSTILEGMFAVRNAFQTRKRGASCVV